MRLVSICILTFLSFSSSAIFAQGAEWQYGLTLGANYNSYMLVTDHSFIYHGRPGFVISPVIEISANQQIKKLLNCINTFFQIFSNGY